MPGKRYAQFIGPSEPLDDRKTSSQRSINLYMSSVDGGGEEKAFVLESAPGLTELVEMPATVRGWVVARGVWYVAAGDTLYTLAADGTYSDVGTLNTSSGYVSMREMRDQLVIVDGSSGYVFNLDTQAFSRITDPDFEGSDWVEDLDGYAVFVAPNTERFYISAIDDASSMDALDFSSADSQPDNIITHRVVRRELLLMGSRSIETWINSGDPDFPFARYNSTPIDVGVVGKRAAVNAADSLYWVGVTGRGAAYVYELQGHQPIRISTQAVEESLATSADISACTMWTYQDSGAEFVGVQAPGVPTTWVFDVATRKWHERCEIDGGEYVASRVDLVIYFDGDHYASAGASIYRMSREIYTLDGDPLPRERVWPHLIHPNLEPVSYRCVEIACTTGSGTDASAVLQISNDGGYTWGTLLQRSLGATGRRMERVRWWGLGTSRDRVFKLRVTDPVPLTLHAATVLT